MGLFYYHIMIVSRVDIDVVKLIIKLGWDNMWCSCNIINIGIYVEW